MTQQSHTGNRRGQTTMSEYVIVFFIVMGALIALAVYVQRALQARIRDANIHAIEKASQGLGEPIPYQYEPYYTKSRAVVDADSENTTRLFGGGTSGIFQKTINEKTEVEAVSIQLPPKDAN